MHGKRIIIHVGTPKTGSTAIQMFLTRNRDILKDMGVGYYEPEKKYHLWEGYSNIDFLLYSVLQELGVSENIRNEDTLVKECKAFAEFCMHYDTLIISDEDLWDRWIDHEGLMQAMKNKLTEICGADTNIDIIVYLRRQDEWLLSRWKENIRSIADETDDFMQAAERYLQSGYLDYDVLLDRVSGVFGHDHIKVRSYDKCRSGERDIIRDFMESAGIELRDGFIRSKTKINRAFSMNATEALRLIKLGKADYDGPWKEMIIAMWMILESDNVFDNAFPMSLEDRRTFLLRFEDSNQRVSERFLGGEALFPNEIKDYRVWKADPERDLNNAKAVVQLAKHYPARREKLKE